MAESYKKAVQVPITTGLTGTFVGFQNTGATAQNVTICGTFIYNSTKVQGADITLNVAAGALVPVNCNKIIPVSHSVLGFVS
jgi:hypothetical protein